MGSCLNNVCVAPMTCGNGMKDGDESDVDCGGGCGPLLFFIVNDLAIVLDVGPVRSGATVGGQRSRHEVPLLRIEDMHLAVLDDVVPAVQRQLAFLHTASHQGMLHQPLELQNHRALLGAAQRLGSRLDLPAGRLGHAGPVGVRGGLGQRGAKRQRRRGRASDCGPGRPVR